jgi:hypothetical protein
MEVNKDKEAADKKMKEEAEEKASKAKTAEQEETSSQS